MKKTLNVLGIIVSALLSIVLVLTLMVSPLLMSTLSLLNPHTLVDAVTKVDMENIVTAIAEDNGAEMDPQQAKQISNLLSTNAAKKIMKTYTGYVIDTLTGKTDTQGLTEEMLRQIVSEHQDEIVQALRDSGDAYATMSDQELRDNIQKTMDESAGEILQMLPDPQVLKQELPADNPQLELGLQLVSSVKTIKLILIGVAALLCLVIFFCRFVDLRGMKWLAVDLLIAGVISAAVCVGLTQWKTLLLFIAEENVLVSNLLAALMGSVHTGLIVRTAIVLVVAIGLLVGYILICKNKKKQKLAVAEKPAEQAPVEEKTDDQTVAEETTTEENAAETAEPNV